MRLRTVPAALVLAVALAACGSDGDVDEAAATSTTTDQPGTTSGGGTGGAECQAMRDAVEGTSDDVGGAMSGDADAFEESIARLERIADDAPEEIRGDLRTLSNAYGELAEALADAGIDPAAGKVPSAEALRKLESLSERFDTAELEEASENVTSWFEETCGS